MIRIRILFGDRWDDRLRTVRINGCMAETSRSVIKLSIAILTPVSVFLYAGTWKGAVRRSVAAVGYTTREAVLCIAD
ncbi:MAG: hypothetical protein LBK58_15675 [Prevotellaceae bacterium]|nr:hypothetical protein [Prevotellaceae bacterium]